MSDTPDQQLSQDLAKRRQQWQAKTFRLMLSIAFIFGIPAAIAAIIGTKLDKAQETGHTWTLIFLVLAFVFSWITTIKMYLKLSREARALDRDYQQYKKSQAKTLDELEEANNKS